MHVECHDRFVVEPRSVLQPSACAAGGAQRPTASEESAAASRPCWSRRQRQTDRPSALPASQRSHCRRQPGSTPPARSAPDTCPPRRQQVPLNLGRRAARPCVDGRQAGCPCSRRPAPEPNRLGRERIEDRRQAGRGQVESPSHHRAGSIGQRGAGSNAVRSPAPGAPAAASGLTRADVEPVNIRSGKPLRRRRRSERGTIPRRLRRKP